MIRLQTPYRSSGGDQMLEAQVLPELGAGLAAFRLVRDGQAVDLVRPAPEPCTSSSDTNFIMAPYSNRIRDGHFVFQGEDYQLANAEKHAIHGDLRDRAFELLNASDTQLHAHWDSSAVNDFNFPFSLRYEVRYALSDSGLSTVLRIYNNDSREVPLGGGFHPYFPRRLDACQQGEVEVQFEASGLYAYSGDLPIAEAAAGPVPEKFSFSRLQALREGIDHCYAGWNQRAILSWPETGVQLLMQGTAAMKHIVFYTPAGDEYFALEPVSHCTDAINLAASGVDSTGLQVVAPGEVLELGYRFQVLLS